MFLLKRLNKWHAVVGVYDYIIINYYYLYFFIFLYTQYFFIVDDEICNIYLLNHHELLTCLLSNVTDSGSTGSCRVGLCKRCLLSLSGLYIYFTRRHSFNCPPSFLLTLSPIVGGAYGPPRVHRPKA